MTDRHLSGEFNAAQLSLAGEMDKTLREKVLNGADLTAIPSLLERGANTNQAGVFGPLILAALDGDVALVQFLIGKNADLERKNVVGVTALMGAIIKKDKDIVCLLVEAGADIGSDNIAYAQKMSTIGISLMLQEKLETRRAAAEAEAREKIRQSAVILKRRGLRAKAELRQVDIKAAP